MKKIWGFVRAITWTVAVWASLIALLFMHRLGTNDQGIREINREMREVDSPTDVLSFPTFDLRPGVLPGEDCM